jgi:hypothetical protein
MDAEENGRAQGSIILKREICPEDTSDEPQSQVDSRRLRQDVRCWYEVVKHKHAAELGVDVRRSVCSEWVALEPGVYASMRPQKPADAGDLGRAVFDRIAIYRFPNAYPTSLPVSSADASAVVLVRG